MSRSASKIRTLQTDACSARPTRFGDTRFSGRTNHGGSCARPQRSHGYHVNNDDKTLLNDSAEHGCNTGAEQHELDSSASDGEDDQLFGWNSEQELLRDLMQEGPRESEEDRLDILVDKVGAPFGEKRKVLNEEMARTFVPAMLHVNALHKILEEHADVSYSKGLVLFNNACKDLEAATLDEYQLLVKTYESTRANIANLMEQLKAEYDHRNCLWQDLEQKMNEIANSTTSEIQDAPAQVERTVAKLEKYWQSMDKDKDSTVFSEKRLKELISKLA